MGFAPGRATVQSIDTVLDIKSAKVVVTGAEFS